VKKRLKEIWMKKMSTNETTKLATLISSSLVSAPVLAAWEIFQANPESGDEVDVMTLEKDRALYQRLNGRNILFLKKVEKAQQKILDGTYGICEECDCKISTERLAARPTATLCITCQETKEKVEFNTYTKRRDLSA
jgi:RNA polymerase-binding protein DksA